MEKGFSVAEEDVVLHAAVVAYQQPAEQAADSDNEEVGRNMG